MIIENMKQADYNNMGVYLREMALYGNVIFIDINEAQELLKQLNDVIQNINQIMKRK